VFTFTNLCAQNKSFPVINKVDSLFNPFDSIHYDKVVAFNLNFDTVKNMKTRKDLYYSESIAKFNYEGISKSSIRVLDSMLLSELISTLSDSSTYGQQHSDCFEPRFGLNFFYNNNTVLSILICFDCNYLESSIVIPASMKSYHDIKSFEWDDDKQKENKRNPIYIRKYLNGFSPKGKQRLLSICAQLKMNYCNN